MAWPIKSDGSALRFTVRIRGDGTARVTGTIRLEDDKGRRILVAERGGANASCADTNGDGVAGLVRLEAVFRNAKAKRRVLVVLVPAGADIGASGVHDLILQVGEEAPVTGTGFVRVSQDSIPQRS
jgi:hypothetical protein